MIWFLNILIRTSGFWFIFFETSEDDIETVATPTAKQQYHMRDDEIEEYTKKSDPKKK